MTDMLFEDITENGLTAQDTLDRYLPSIEKYYNKLSNNDKQKLAEVKQMIPSIDNDENNIDLTISFCNKLADIAETSSSWEKEEKNAKQTIKNMLEKYDYDTKKIQDAINNIENNVEQERNREDWDAEFYPTEQGMMDAQDLRNERMGDASENLYELQKALELLESLRSNR